MAVIIALLISLLAPLGAHAQDSALFVESVPFGASVTIDGAAVDGATPLLLRGIPPGRHVIALAKEGYRPALLNLETGPVAVARSVLTREEVSLLFDGEPQVNIGRRELPAASGILRLQGGTTAIRNTGPGIELLPVFPRQRALDGLRFALPLFIGLTAVIFARDVFDPRPSTLALSPELIASTAMAGGLLAFDLGFERQKRRFLESVSVSSQAAGGSSPVVQALVELGKKSLARGEFATALSVFGQSAAENPESSLTPYCLFECGRISAINGDYEGAARFYRRIIDEYPVSALYDRTRKNLADLLMLQAEYGAAIDELDAMVFIDPGLSREDIESYREELRKRF